MSVPSFIEKTNSDDIIIQIPYIPEDRELGSSLTWQNYPFNFSDFVRNLNQRICDIEERGHRASFTVVNWRIKSYIEYSITHGHASIYFTDYAFGMMDGKLNYYGVEILGSKPLPMSSDVVVY